MGRTLSTLRGKKNEDPIAKEGYLYSDLKDHIQPLDLILFKGSDFVSDIIRLIEYVDLDSNWAEQYTHSALVVTKELLNDDRLEDGKLYVWESTISGKLGNGVKNIDGKSFLGVQLRLFDDVIAAYDEPNNTRVSWCQLNNNPWLIESNRPELSAKFKTIFDQYNGIRYDLNIFSLVSSFFKRIRPLRKTVEKILHTDKWLFCSELVALVYKDLAILPESVNEKNVLPVDFISGVDEDKEIPKSFVKYPIGLLTPIHYDPENTLDITTLKKDLNIH
jgi:hypothetical protein